MKKSIRKIIHKKRIDTERITPSNVSIGYLEVIAGPMYCGKTEELIRQVKRAKIGKGYVQVFKPNIDIRYGKGKKLFSHTGMSFDCEIIHKTNEILDKTHKQTKIVAIDEAQWMGEELITVVQTLLNWGKHVVVTGLALTYDRQPFIPIPTLMAMADKVTKLSSVCMICGEDAVYHKRITKGTTVNPLKSDPSLVKTLKDRVYEARCRNCFHKKP